MTAELDLILKIILTKDMITPRSFGLTEQMFTKPHTRQMYAFILDYYNNRNHFGCVPTVEDMQQAFPVFPDTPQEPAKTLPEYCERLRKTSMYIEAKTEITDLLDNLDNVDIEESVAHLRTLSDTLSRYAPNIRARDLGSTGQEFLDWYSNAPVHGVPWPWDDMTNATNGFEDGTFWLFFGRPKTMKTFVAGDIMLHTFLKAHQRALIYSGEMDPFVFELRLRAAVAGVNYAKMKRRELDTEEQLRLKRGVELVNDLSSSAYGPAIRIVPLSDCPNKQHPLDHFRAEVEKFGASIAAVDSYYRLAQSRKNNIQADLTMRLSTLTKTLRIPVLATTQRSRLNSNGEEAEDNQVEDIGFTDAGGQECDGAIRVRNLGHYPDGARLITLTIAAGRETEHVGSSLHLRIRPADIFEQIGWERAESKELVDQAPQPVVRTPRPRAQVVLPDIPKNKRKEAESAYFKRKD
jgi:replicative DNA helicase